jgi:hypothetical protein
MYALTSEHELLNVSLNQQASNGTQLTSLSSVVRPSSY